MNPTEWGVEWVKPKEIIRILGIDWQNTLEKTTEYNCIILNKIKFSIQGTINRNLTLQQTTVYFNCVLVPKIEYIAKILPILPKTAEEIQTIGYSFIWQGKLEKLAKTELYLKKEEGGLT